MDIIADFGSAVPSSSLGGSTNILIGNPVIEFVIPYSYSIL